MMNVVRMILTVLVAAAFVFFSIVKIAGVPEGIFKEQKENYFDNYGIDRNGMRLIGAAELISALLVLAGLSWNFIQAAQIGNISLMVITAGAAYHHNKYDSLTKDGLPAMIQFALNAILLIMSFTVLH